MSQGLQPRDTEMAQGNSVEGPAAGGAVAGGARAVWGVQLPGLWAVGSAGLPSLFAGRSGLGGLLCRVSLDTFTPSLCWAGLWGLVGLWTPRRCPCLSGAGVLWVLWTLSESGSPLLPLAEGLGATWHGPRLPLCG